MGVKMYPLNEGEKWGSEHGDGLVLSADSRGCHRRVETQPQERYQNKTLNSEDMFFKPVCMCSKLLALGKESYDKPKQHIKKQRQMSV